MITSNDLDQFCGDLAFPATPSGAGLGT
ncbi:hypothetical protein LCGC14_2506450, partial [marine sediment metagenome]